MADQVNNNYLPQLHQKANIIFIFQIIRIYTFIDKTITINDMNLENRSFCKLIRNVLIWHDLNSSYPTDVNVQRNQFSKLPEQNKRETLVLSFI